MRFIPWDQESPTEEDSLCLYARPPSREKTPGDMIIELERYQIYLQA